MKKKILSMALALVMCLSLMPTVALAAGGSVTEEDVLVSPGTADFGSIAQGIENRSTVTRDITITNISDKTIYFQKSADQYGDTFHNSSRAYLFDVYYSSDDGNDGILEPGESAVFTVEVANSDNQSGEIYTEWAVPMATSYDYIPGQSYGGVYTAAYNKLVNPGYITISAKATVEEFASENVLSLDVSELDFGMFSRGESADVAAKNVTVTNNSNEPVRVKVAFPGGTNFDVNEAEDQTDEFGRVILDPGEEAVFYIKPLELGSGVYNTTVLFEAYRTVGRPSEDPVYTAELPCTARVVEGDAEFSYCKVQAGVWSTNGGWGKFVYSGEGEEPAYPYFYAVPGSDLTVTIIPDEGCYIKDVRIKYNKYDDYTSVGAVTSYTFTNLTQNAWIEAEFDRGEAPEQPSSWAVSFVDQAKAAGIVPEALQSGYTTPITRAEYCALATALYESIKGEITERKTFTDTTDVNVEKMAAIGVVDGVGNNMFSPNSKLTREQAATMLSRLAEALGKPFAETAPTFADNDSISDWAFAAVGKVQANGIMNGVGNNNFSPLTDYTREQSIITMVRMMEYAK